MIPSTPVGSKSGRAAVARSTNRSLAGPNGRTGQTYSPFRPSASREVAITTASVCEMTCSTSSAVASIRCSQLSNNNTARRCASQSNTASHGDVFGAGLTDNTDITMSTIASGSPSTPRSRKNAPSGNSSPSWQHSSIAKRVLPTPPTPVNVVKRCRVTTDRRSAISSARPRKSVAGDGRLPSLLAVLSRSNSPAPTCHNDVGDPNPRKR